MKVAVQNCCRIVSLFIFFSKGSNLRPLCQMKLLKCGKLCRRSQTGSMDVGFLCLFTALCFSLLRLVLPLGLSLLCSHLPPVARLYGCLSHSHLSRFLDRRWLVLPVVGLYSLSFMSALECLFASGAVRPISKFPISFNLLFLANSYLFYPLYNKQAMCFVVLTYCLKFAPIVENVGPLALAMFFFSFSFTSQNV